MSDIDGLYDADPHTKKDAKLIHRVENLDDEIDKMAGGAGTKRGTGGMVTKISAAKIATKAGCDMIIMNGAKPEKLYDIMEGKEVGTRFVGNK